MKPTSKVSTVPALSTSSSTVPLAQQLAQQMAARRAVIRPRANSNSNTSNWSGGGNLNKTAAKKLAYEAMVEKAAENFLRQQELSVEELNKLKKQALTHQIPSLFSKKPSSLNTESVNTPFGKVPARMFKRQSHKQYNSGENNINSTRRPHRTRRNRN